MEDFDFTEDEIREQLDILGYSNVPNERLQDFKRDLESLVRHERSKNSSLFSTSEQSSSTDSEVGRGVHTQLTGHSRPPQDDGHHRLTAGNVNTGNTSHPAYNKENIYIASPPAHPPGTSKHPPAPDYTLYTEPQGRAGGPEDGPHPGDVTLDTSTTSTERRVIKRKVLRKRDGRAEIYETESESGDMDSLQERLHALGLSVDLQRPRTAPPPARGPGSDAYTCRRALSARDPEPYYRLPDDYEGPKALIRPMTSDPHQKNIRKSDPVSRFQQYRSSWENHRAPGERPHKGLRWGVREQMLHHDQVVDKKQKVFIPNNYKVPTEKKRKNLRWQIRNDLAQGVVPPSMFD